MPIGVGFAAGVAGFDTGFVPFAAGVLGVVKLIGLPPGVGAVARVAVRAVFGAGVEDGFISGSDTGFGFNLVTRKENLAPELLGSHSMKLYVGK